MEREPRAADGIRTSRIALLCKLLPVARRRHPDHFRKPTRNVSSELNHDFAHPCPGAVVGSM